MKDFDEKFKDTLKPTYFMDWKHPTILEKAKELTDGIEDDLEKAISISEQVLSETKNGYTEGFKVGLSVLKSKLGEITQKVDRHLKRVKD